MAEYVRDTFTRSVASGWGTAEVGGAYTQDLVACTANTSGTGLHGLYQLTANVGPMRGDSRLSAATAAADVALASIISTNSTWAIDTSCSLWLRASGSLVTPVGYFARARFVRSDFSIVLELGYSATGAEVIIASQAYPAGSWAAAAQDWRLEAHAWHASPTQLRARVYRPAVGIPAESAGWLQATDETGPQVAGSYQVRGVRGTHTAATNIAFSDLYASDYPLPAFTQSVVGQVLTVDSSSSTGDYTARSWNWGDGTAAGSGTSTSHTYATPGTYLVTLTCTTRWGATFTASQFVAMASWLPLPTDVLPQVVINGVDVCDDVFSVSWSLGRNQWADGFAGLTASIGLRGTFATEQGQPVSISIPDYAGGAPLWVGIVDTVSEVHEPINERNETTVIAMDTASQLARRHLPRDTILASTTLPNRLDDLAPTNKFKYRYRYSVPVASGRWLQLKKLTQAADDLRSRTYLELVTDALAASLAFGYTARDGAISYAPWDAPPSLPSTPRIDLNTGADCAARVTLVRDSVEGIVNRWNIGGGTDYYQAQNQPSIEKYGERAYVVSDGVLFLDADFPFGPTNFPGMVTQLAEPLRAAEVEVPVTAWGQKVIACNPLDFATWNGHVYSILGIRHEVSVGRGWRVTLNLDRNPWEMDGRTVP